MKWVIGVLIVLVLSLGYALKSEIQEHTKTQVTLDTTNATLDAYKDSVLKAKNESIDFSKKSLDYQTQYTKAVRQLNDLKGREALILKKRSLIELRINKAFTSGQYRLACLTGDTTACQK